MRNHVKQKSRTFNRKYDNSLTAMALPGILFVFVFCYLPMIGIIVAFKDFNVKDGILFSPWSGFKNFEFFLKSQDIARLIVNTLGLNFIFIVSSTVIQITFAVIMNEMKNRLFVKITNSLMFLPYFISWVIAGYFVYALLNMDYGLINNLLVSVGLQPVEWFNRPEYWPAILTLANIWKITGYGCIIYTAGIVGINEEYYEAASVDGATRWQQVFKITLPMIRPLIIILTLLALGKIFYSDFGMFYNLTRNAGTLYSTTDVMDTYVFRALRVTGDFGMSAAAGLFQSIVGFVLVFASNRLVKRIDSESALF